MQVVALAQATVDGDIAEVQYLSHALKGSAETVGVLSFFLWLAISFIRCPRRTKLEYCIMYTFILMQYISVLALSIQLACWPTRI